MARGYSGKRIVFNVGFALNLFNFCLQLMAFVSPYWFQSWPRVHSQFKKIGLWEACFAGLILPRDPAEKAYYGCWWILAPYYWNIRRWVMPWWFVITQVVCTVCIVLQFLNCIFSIYTWVVTATDSSTGAKKRPPMNMVNAITIVTIVNAVAMSATVILFGSAVYVDRVWMPRPDLNYLSWSYGLEVVGAFVLIFASICVVVFNRIIRQELREPPSLTTPMMTLREKV